MVGRLTVDMRDEISWHFDSGLTFKLDKPGIIQS